LGLIVVACLSNGCGGKSAGERVYPVQGQVFYEGKPAAKATVFLIPVGAAPGAVRPHATVEDDGSFQVSTYGLHDGAPAGKYDVTVVWTKPARGDDVGDSLIPTRYGDPRTSKLSVEIKEQPNELAPFRLTR
jgi:hypothetical protein